MELDYYRFVVWLRFIRDFGGPHDDFVLTDVRDVVFQAHISYGILVMAY